MKESSTKRVKITCNCNQDCIFCDSNADSNPKLYSKKRVKLQISQGIGLKRLNITGGEPTICKNLEEYIELARKTGYKDIAMLTNGNKFADKKYALRIKKAGLTEAIVSVYHCDPKISDQISKVRGSFLRKIKGITNLKNLGVKITVNVVIFSGNYSAITQIVEYLHKAFGIKNFAFSFLEPNCDKVSRNKEMISDLKKSMASLKKTISYCRKKKIQYFIPYHGAVPPCIFKMENMDVTKPEKVIGADFDLSRSHLAPCLDCEERLYCLGFLKEYSAECLEILKKKE